MTRIIRNLLSIPLGILMVIAIHLVLQAIENYLFPFPSYESSYYNSVAGYREDLTELQNALDQKITFNFYFEIVRTAIAVFCGSVLAYVIAFSRKKVYTWSLAIVCMLFHISFEYYFFGLVTIFTYVKTAVAYLPMAALAIFIGRLFKRKR